MGVDRCYVHEADKKSIDELEGKEVDRRFVHDRKGKNRRRANAGRQSLGSNRNRKAEGGLREREHEKAEA